MYGKLFESMYDGTLAESWQALVTFQQMIILCDSEGVVDMTPQAISRRTGIPIEHIQAGIEVLESPDPHSRTNIEEGRRIVPIDTHKPWGWIIVNHNKYRNLKDQDEVRERNRERKRKQREREKAASNVFNDESQQVTERHAQSQHTDTDAKLNLCAINSDGDTKFDAFWDLYPRKQNKKKARTAFNRLPAKKQQAALKDIKTRSWNSEQKFIPYASTYLNNERWDDQSTIVPSQPEPWQIGAV